jgi:diacylglycerol kinase family enzyme
VELARAAVAEGAELILTLGGDGTINEVVNGAAGGSVALAFLPGGGANVLARSLGVPRDSLRAVRLLLSRLDRTPRLLPLGRVDGRYFAANCGLGFDAETVRRVERHPWLKHGAGDVYFAWQGLLAFFLGYDRRTPHIEVAWGDELEFRRGDLYLAILQNTDPYTFVGRLGLRLCPDASVAGGLDLFGLDTMRTHHAASILISALGSARHRSNSHVLYLRNQPRIAIRSSVPMPLQMDGEYVGERTEILVESSPDAVSVLS